MYGTKTIAGSTALGGLAYTGLNVGWMVLSAVVLLVCGATLARLSRSRPSQMLGGAKRRK